MAWNYKCKKCGCLLDVSEMPYCDECKEDMKQEEVYRKQWALDREQYAEVRKALQRA